MTILARFRGWTIGTALVLAVLIYNTTSAGAVSGIRDTEIEAMLREYADPILLAAGIPPETTDIYILNDSSINAFVTRTNSMYIHTGLLLQSDRPAQVIGVIAHEAGHIAGRHVARISDAYEAASTPMMITMGLGLLAAIAGAPDAGMALMASGQHIAERTILAHSRDQESAADQSAVTYLDRTKQSSVGLLEVQEKFRHMEVLSARNQNPYVRTHPLSTDRIAALRSRIESSPYAEIRETPKSLFEFDMMQAKLYAFVNRPDLTYRKYPKSSQSLPARYARAIAYFREPDIAKAIGEVDLLIAEQPDNPYFHELGGQVLFESGQAVAAVPYHRKSVELLPQAPLLRINLAQALLANDNNANVEDAIRHLNEAIKQEKSNSFAWYLLSQAYARSNRLGMAELSTAEQHYHNRNLGNAIQFAKRAQGKLDKGSPQWQRAVDIIQVATVEQAKDGRR